MQGGLAESLIGVQFQKQFGDKWSWDANQAKRLRVQANVPTVDQVLRVVLQLYDADVVWSHDRPPLEAVFHVTIDTDRLHHLQRRQERVSSKEVLGDNELLSVGLDVKGAVVDVNRADVGREGDRSRLGIFEKLHV